MCQAKVAAKINLMLDILKRLENGYHSLFMIMQSVDLYDTVTVQKNNENKIIIKCNTDGVPCNEKNIAYKCVNAFFELTGVTQNFFLSVLCLPIGRSMSPSSFFTLPYTIAL